MKRVFISYRFTGENKTKLKSTLVRIHEAFEKAGYSHYSTVNDSDQFADEKWSGKKIMKKAFKEIDSSDLVLFFVKSPKISQGMLVELGYVLAKNKKSILAIKKEIDKSIFRRQLDRVIEFEDINDLISKIKLIKI